MPRLSFHLSRSVLAGVIVAASAVTSAEASSFTNFADWDAGVLDREALSFAGELGQYGDPLGGNGLNGNFDNFPGFPVSGPTDPDAANYVDQTLDLAGSIANATVSADNKFNNSFFLLDDPNDGNDVDGTPGEVVGGGDFDPYLSFYGNNGSLTFDFDQPINSFGFESFDFAEGPVLVEWTDGVNTVSEVVGGNSETFFGVNDPDFDITSVSISLLTEQGVAIGDFYVATVIPSPSAAASLLVLGGTLSLRRRWRN